MAKLSTAARNSLPKSDFGIPATRSYPMPNASHAINAKARATQQHNAGKLSTPQVDHIDRMANARLAKMGHTVK